MIYSAFANAANNLARSGSYAVSIVATCIFQGIRSFIHAKPASSDVLEANNKKNTDSIKISSLSAGNSIDHSFLETFSYELLEEFTTYYLSRRQALYSNELSKITGLDFGNAKAYSEDQMAKWLDLGVPSFWIEGDLRIEHADPSLESFSYELLGKFKFYYSTKLLPLLKTLNFAISKSYDEDVIVKWLDDLCTPSCLVRGDPCIKCFADLVFDAKDYIAAKDQETKGKALISFLKNLKSFENILQYLEDARIKKKTN
jgi:hypothetical protein